MATDFCSCFMERLLFYISEYCFLFHSSVNKSNFVALKNRGIKYRRLLLSQIWAILLLVTFISPLLVETFHQHHEALKCEKPLKHGESEITVSKVKCSLCDVIKHRIQFFDIPKVQCVQVHPSKPLDGYMFYAVQKSAGYIHCCANKGPPSA